MHPWICIASLAGNLFSACALAAFVHRRRRARPAPGVHPAPAYDRPYRKRFVAELPIRPDSLVFLGDSLASLGPWGDLFDRAANRGVPADSVAAVLRRDGPLAGDSPRAVVILLGTFDLMRGRPVAVVLDDYRTLLGRLRAEVGRVPIVVVGVSPGAPHAAECNAALRDACRPPVATYLDPGLSHDYLVADGIHLSAPGYVRLAERLRPLVE